jgi:hypothetical protein
MPLIELAGRGGSTGTTLATGACWRGPLACLTYRRNSSKPTCFGRPVCGRMSSIWPSRSSILYRYRHAYAQRHADAGGLMGPPGRLPGGDPATAATRLRRQQARLESSPDARLTDPADRCRGRRCRRPLRPRRSTTVPGLGLSHRVRHLGNRTGHEVAAVRALTASLLVDTCTLSYRTAQAWATALPLGLDLRASR